MSHINVGGTWRKIDGSWVNINGVWREVDSISPNISGTWREGWVNYDPLSEGVLYDFGFKGTPIIAGADGIPLGNSLRFLDMSTYARLQFYCCYNESVYGYMRFNVNASGFTHLMFTGHFQGFGSAFAYLYIRKASDLSILQTHSYNTGYSGATHSPMNSLYAFNSSVLNHQGDIIIDIRGRSNYDEDCCRGDSYWGGQSTIYQMLMLKPSHTVIVSGSRTITAGATYTSELHDFNGLRQLTLTLKGKGELQIVDEANNILHTAAFDTYYSDGCGCSGYQTHTWHLTTNLMQYQMWRMQKIRSKCRVKITGQITTNITSISAIVVKPHSGW